MAQKATPLLYSFWRSSCTWRVRLALNLKEIPYEIHPVCITKPEGDQHSSEYQQINPMQQVPALQIDGTTLVESLNILHYLEETRPQRPLLPSDPIKRAKVREICEIIASGIQPYQNINVQKQLDPEKRKEWLHYFLGRGLRAVEKLVSASSGKYSVGDEITLADCCIIPQVFHARNFGLDMGSFVNILRIEKELEDHPAFRNAHPWSQPDCPPEEAKRSHF